jgi:hypothetical protein
VKLAPRRTLEGTVTCQESGRPLADVLVTARTESAANVPLPLFAEARTDAKGSFRLHPFPGEHVSMLVYPRADEPYMIGQHSFRWTKNHIYNVQITLRRGVLLQGRIMEEGSGKPVPGATIRFHARTVNHPILSRRRNGETVIAAHLANTASAADGTFRLAVLPGLGHLLVNGMKPDYLHVETSTRFLQAGKPGGTPWHVDSLVPLDLSPDSGPLDMTIKLQRGVTGTYRWAGRPGAGADFDFLPDPAARWVSNHSRPDLCHGRSFRAARLRFEAGGAGAVLRSGAAPWRSRGIDRGRRADHPPGPVPLGRGPLRGQPWTTRF